MHEVPSPQTVLNINPSIPGGPGFARCTRPASLSLIPSILYIPACAGKTPPPLEKNNRGES